MQVVHPVCCGIDGYGGFTLEVAQVGIALTGESTAYHRRLIQGKVELMEPFSPSHANIKR